MAGKSRIRKAIILFTSLCSTLLLCITAAAAQNHEFRLEADSLNFQKGVSRNIVISLVNAQDAELISIDGIENFDVLSKNTSTSTTIVNNEVSYQTDIYCTIMPKTAGQFTLKANISYNGQYYETNSLEVTVSEGSNSSGRINSDLFVETVLSHTEAYLGEKIILTYELYSRQNIESLGFTDYIAVDGAIAKEFQEGQDNQILSETVYMDGERYTKYIVKQLIIDPLKTGICTIPSFNLQVNVISNNSFGGFGGFGGLLRSAEPKYLQTDEKEISVIALPSEGRPDDFSGIVGELNLSGYYSRSELNYGDSLVLQTEASGNCNLDSLKAVIGGELPNFTVYETHKNTSETVLNDQYYAKKGFETILIPEKTGELIIPGISISYFNPSSGKYETAEIEGTAINVLGDMPVQSVEGAAQGGGTIFINQVSYADVNPVSNDYFNVQIRKELLYKILTAAVIVLVLALAAVTAVVVLRRKIKQNEALKSLYNKIKNAKDINEIYNLFNAMIKHCYDLNLKAGSKERVREVLPDADLASQVTDVMDYMEFGGDNGEKSDVHLKNKIKNVYYTKLLFSLRKEKSNQKRNEQ